MVAGIPLGILIAWLIPQVFCLDTVARYSLDNFFVNSGITQAGCVLLMVTVSLLTRPKPVESISSLMLKRETFSLPPDEPKRPFCQSIWLWWVIFALVYVVLYVKLW
jgi:hypothetical protein